MPGTRDAEVPEEWFEEVFGIKEESYAQIRKQFEYGAGLLVCKANGKMFTVGTFRTPSLSQLHEQLEKAKQEAAGSYFIGGELTFENVCSDSISLHQDPGSAGAVFQVSSLFNCLETVNGMQPEEGISHYGPRGCQGSACAVACPAATLFRNYFVNVKGQAAGGRKIDCLAEAAEVVDNQVQGYWIINRGYCLPRVDGSVARLSHKLATDPNLEAKVRDAVQVGVHWETEVLDAPHKVCQVFCSALPISALVSGKSHEWMAFAKVILEAAYDATLTAAACLAARRGERVKVFLTAVGAAELGNRVSWIAGAIQRALEKHASEPLDVCLVHCMEEPRFDYQVLETGRKPLVATQTPKSRCPVTPSMGLKKKLDDLEIEMPDDDLAAEMRFAFAQYDGNGDGVIDRNEFCAMLGGLDSDFFTPHVIQMLLQEADTDNDGRIHYHEFVSWICQEDEEIVQRLLRPG